MSNTFDNVSTIKRSKRHQEVVELILEWIDLHSLARCSRRRTLFAEANLSRRRDLDSRFADSIFYRRSC